MIPQNDDGVCAHKIPLDYHGHFRWSLQVFQVYPRSPVFGVPCSSVGVLGEYAIEGLKSLDIPTLPIRYPDVDIQNTVSTMHGAVAFRNHSG